MKTPALSRTQRAFLRNDFASWSGGFAPASPAEITVFIEYASQTQAPPEVTKRVLEKWMNDPDRFEARAPQP